MTSTQTEKPDLFVIAGPTASGKTKLGVELAKIANGEVVSADSMQIYRELNIGTAKPTVEEMEGIPHHMLDILDPQDSFSVAQYVDRATTVIEEIKSRGKLPILVGGTGLYIDSLLKNRAFAPIPNSRDLRESLETEVLQVGGDVLLNRLAEKDPETASRLFPNDHKRIIRALEIVETTGKTQWAFDLESQSLPPHFRAVGLVLNFPEREDLRQRIYQRVGLMLEQGLLKEVESFLHLPKDCTAMQAIGYKELRGAITGEQTLEEAVELLKIRSRQYAKRQITWFKNKSALPLHNWEKIPNLQNALQVSTKYLEDYRVI